MSLLFPVIQPVNPFEKLCLWALMIAINIAICQLPNRQFCSFGKKSIPL